MTKKKPFTNYTEQAFYVGWLYGKLPHDKKDAFIGWVLASDPSRYQMYDWMHTNGMMESIDADEFCEAGGLADRLNWYKYVREVDEQFEASEKADKIKLICGILLLIGIAIWAAVAS